MCANNYQSSNFYKINPPRLTRRIDLNTGPLCNLRCEFCYYIKDVQTQNRQKNLTTKECKKLILYYKTLGMEILEFTGGEPTIRSDFFELVTFAKQTGFKRISLITNGICLSDKNYVKNTVDSGVSDFLFSVHGSKTYIHDKITKVPGSYDKLIQAVKNLQNYNVRIRFNSVITGNNLADIRPRAELFYQLGVKTVNFIIFNPLEQTDFGDESNYCRYSECATVLKKVIDDFGESFEKFTIRYMPLCCMTGYEKHVQNVHQVHYDHDEWDYYIRSRVRESFLKWFAGLLIGVLVLPEKRKWIQWGVDHLKHAGILQAHTVLNKYKPKKCKNCKYGFICGGIWRKYFNKYGDSELITQEGELIIEPWYFMPDNQRAEFDI